MQKGSIIVLSEDNGTGQYFSPDGSSYESRALPPFMKDKPYERYEVIREYDTKSGKVALWFGEEGMEFSFYTDFQIKDRRGNNVMATVENLLKYKYIRPIKRPPSRWSFKTIRHYGMYSRRSKIDTKVKEIEKAEIPKWLKDSFTDGVYRAVKTNENLTFYRTYGGSAKKIGGFE